MDGAASYSSNGTTTTGDSGSESGYSSGSQQIGFMDGPQLLNTGAANASHSHSGSHGQGGFFTYAYDSDYSFTLLQRGNYANGSLALETIALVRTGWDNYSSRSEQTWSTSGTGVVTSQSSGTSGGELHGNFAYNYSSLSTYTTQFNRYRETTVTQLGESAGQSGHYGHILVNGRITESGSWAYDEVRSETGTGFSALDTYAAEGDRFSLATLYQDGTWSPESWSLASYNYSAWGISAGSSTRDRAESRTRNTLGNSYSATATTHTTSNDWGGFTLAETGTRGTSGFVFASYDLEEDYQSLTTSVMSYTRNETWTTPPPPPGLGLEGGTYNNRNTTGTLTSTEAITGYGRYIGSGGGASFSYSAYDYDEVIRTHSQADDLTTFTGDGYTTLDGYWIRSETTDSLLTHMEVGSGLSAALSDDFTSRHSYSLTIVNANGSDNWTWDEDAAWFVSDFFALEAPDPSGIMSNPLLADVDLLFGRNLEATGFLKYANTARTLLGDIPMSQGSSAKLDDGGAAGNLSGKSDGSGRATPQHSGGGNTHQLPPGAIVSNNGGSIAVPLPETNPPQKDPYLAATIEQLNRSPQPPLRLKLKPAIAGVLEQIKERENQRFGRTPPPLWDAIRPRLIGGLQIIAGAGMMKLGMLVAPVNPYIGSGLFVLGYQYVGTGAVNIKDGTEKQPWLIDRAKQGAETVGLPPEIVDTMELLLSMGGAQLAPGAGALGTTKPLLPGTPPPWVQLPKRATPPEVGARLGIPVLRQGSIKEMFLEMQGWMRANRNASQAQLADFFEGMARQISNAHPSWQANRTVLSDGTIAFIGRNAENIFAIRPNGQMLQSNPAVGALRINPQTGKYELNYSVMREID